MAIAFLIGRIILGIYWLQTAYNHLFKSTGLIGYTQSKGIKSASAAKLAVWGTGILALIGGLSIILGIHPHYGIACLVIFLVGVSFKMHAYWKIQDPMQKMGERVNFTKNMALAAAILALVAVSQPWVYSFGW
jgi:uncharacterized membrane protein YphA (DoxX/SURF4 family)